MNVDGPHPVDVAELLDRIADLEKRLAATGDRQDMFAQALDAFEDAVHSAAAVDVAALAVGERDDTEQDRQPEKIDMAVLYDWVHTHVGQWAQRKIPRSATGTSGVRWCPWWFQHPEAVSRFEALRRAWTFFVAAKDPTAMAVYFRDFYDRTLDALTSETGPFHACSPTEHRETDFVPIVLPPWAKDCAALQEEANIEVMPAASHADARQQPNQNRANQLDDPTDLSEDSSSRPRDFKDGFSG